MTMFTKTIGYYFCHKCWMCDRVFYGCLNLFSNIQFWHLRFATQRWSISANILFGTQYILSPWFPWVSQHVLHSIIYLRVWTCLQKVPTSQLQAITVLQYVFF